MTVGQSRVLFSLPYHFLSDSLCALDFKHPSVSGDFQMLFPSLAFSLSSRPIGPSAFIISHPRCRAGILTCQVHSSALRFLPLHPHSSRLPTQMLRPKVLAPSLSLPCSSYSSVLGFSTCLRELCRKLNSQKSET